MKKRDVLVCVSACRERAELGRTRSHCAAFCAAPDCCGSGECRSRADEGAWSFHKLKNHQKPINHIPYFNVPQKCSVEQSIPAIIIKRPQNIVLYFKFEGKGRKKRIFSRKSRLVSSCVLLVDSDVNVCFWQFHPVCPRHLPRTCKPPFFLVFCATLLLTSLT